MSIESRLQALEKHAAEALPVYLVTYKNGSSARIDALSLLLRIAALEAGRADTEDIKDIKHISGIMPAGSAWDSLNATLQQYQREGAKNGT